MHICCKKYGKCHIKLGKLLQTCYCCALILIYNVDGFLTLRTKDLTFRWHTLTQEATLSWTVSTISSACGWTMMMITILTSVGTSNFMSAGPTSPIWTWLHAALLSSGTEECSLYQVSLWTTQCMDWAVTRLEYHPQPAATHKNLKTHKMEAWCAVR